MVLKGIHEKISCGIHHNFHALIIHKPHDILIYIVRKRSRNASRQDEYIAFRQLFYLVIQGFQRLFGNLGPLSVDLSLFHALYLDIYP